MTVKAVNGGVATAFPPEAWQLATGYFMPAKFPPVIVNPRPDAGLPTWARQSNAYPNVEYRLPVVVQGGAWPFKYELTTFPTGMTIGSTYGTTASPNADYGIIKWTPSATGSAETVVVLVTDQDGTTATVTFTVTPNTTNFVFFDIGDGTSLDTGTIAEPYNSWASILNNGNSGKLMYWRGGSYATEGSTIFDEATDAVVNIGYPGEVVDIDLRKGGFTFTSNDVWHSNLLLRYAPHYSSISGSESNISITESSGVYTVAKTGHGYGNSGTNDSIAEDGAGLYTVTRSGIGLVGFPSMTPLVTITGAVPSDFNGTWAVTSSSANSFQIDVTTTGLTATNAGSSTWDFISIYGATPSTLDGDYAITYIDANSFSYITTAGIGNASTAGNSAVTRKNPKMVSMGSGWGRWAFYENDMRDFDFVGWAGTDNPCCIWQPGGATGTYRSIVHNTFTNFNTPASNGGAAYITYNSDYIVSEGNVVDTFSGTYVGRFKVANNNSTTRNNNMTGVCSATESWLVSGGNTSAHDFQEVCWNSAKSGDYIILWASAGYTYNDIYCYRNTAVDRYQSLNSGVPLIEDCISQDTINANFTLGTGSNQNYPSKLPSDFNSDLTITDSALASISRNRGEVGHEIIKGNR